MALIGKIRNNFWFVLLVLGLALAAFVIMDMVGASNRAGLGAKQVIGSVAGQEIDFQDFNQAEQALYSGSSDPYAGKASTWNYLVENGIIDAQSEELGLNVSNQELMDLQFGANPSPVIRSTFTNSQTGQLDVQQLLQIKQAIEGDGDLESRFETSWIQIQKQIKKTAKQEKLNTLVSKAIYTPAFQAETAGLNNSASAGFEYVKIPFDKIDDGDVELSDATISSYIKEKAHLYTNDEETRVINYAVFDVEASDDDIANIKSGLTDLIENFKTAENDSNFVQLNTGVFNPYYITPDQASGALKDELANLSKGDVYGPFEEAGNYVLAKVNDMKVVPDSVEARHILRNVANGNPVELIAAQAYIDSLKTLLTTGQAKFDDLARDNSQDPGSAAKGGDLGTFTQGAMVPEFNDACFIDSRNGGLYTVTTQYGIHLIEVQNRVFDSRDPKYRLAYISRPIVPSEDTQSEMFDKVDEIVAKNRDITSLEAALEAQDGITLEKADPLKVNDYNLATLGGGETSRSIIKWAFDGDTRTGEVSPEVYKYNDPVNFYENKYVITALGAVNQPGLLNAKDATEVIRAGARNSLKGQKLVEQISGTDLSAIASQFETTVETIDNVSLSSASVTGLGNEPQVIAAAFANEANGVSAPIIGNNGVYVVKTTSKNEGIAPNVINQQRTTNTANRSRVTFSLMNALKKQFKPEDNRNTFF